MKSLTYLDLTFSNLNMSDTIVESIISQLNALTNLKKLHIYL